MRYQGFLSLAVLFAGLLFSSVGSSVPSGLGEEANQGCLCHTQDTTTQISFEGLPNAYEANTTYELVLTIISAIEAVDGEPQGGFRILVSNGSLSGNTVLMQEKEGGWTHQEEGVSQRVWNFTWTSPADNSSRTDFTIHANAVNGNHAQTGDGWSTLELVIPGIAHEGTLNSNQAVDDLSRLDMVFLSVALLAIVFSLWSSSRS